MKYYLKFRDAAGTDGTDDSLIANVYHVVDDNGFQYEFRTPPGEADPEAALKKAFAETLGKIEVVDAGKDADVIAAIPADAPVDPSPPIITLEPPQ